MATEEKAVKAPPKKAGGAKEDGVPSVAKVLAQYDKADTTVNQKRAEQMKGALREEVLTAMAEGKIKGTRVRTYAAAALGQEIPLEELSPERAKRRQERDAKMKAAGKDRETRVAQMKERKTKRHDERVAKKAAAATT
ncbi:MAG: hypothetical protein AAGB11_18445 [Pseudomonadota bacterium]